MHAQEIVRISVGKKSKLHMHKYTVLIRSIIALTWKLLSSIFQWTNRKRRICYVVREPRCRTYRFKKTHKSYVVISWFHHLLSFSILRNQRTGSCFPTRELLSKATRRSSFLGSDLWAFNDRERSYELQARSTNKCHMSCEDEDSDKEGGEVPMKRWENEHRFYAPKS